MNNDLSLEQRQAVNATGHCLVVACAGSGKTTLLVAKASSLAMKGQGVALVTFTREASEEISRRIRASVGYDNDVFDLVMVGTFHSYAYRQLFQQMAESRSNGNQRTPRISVLSPADKQTTLKLVLKQSGTNMSISEAEVEIDRFLDGGIVTSRNEKIIEAYFDKLSKHGQTDLGSLVSLVVEGLQKGQIPPIETDHILVDEYQDTDSKQYDWLQFHTQRGAVATVVGDDDQSVYGFRRAMGFKGMERFVEEHSAQMIALRHNYRCALSVLSAADTIIHDNQNRYPKEMRGANPTSGSAKIYHHLDSEDSEVARICETVQSDPGQWAVLSRTTFRYGLLIRTFIDKGIPYQTLNEQSLIEDPSVNAFTSLLLSLEDRCSISLVTTLTWAGLTVVQAEMIVQEIQANQPISENANYPLLVRTFSTLYPSWRKQAKSNPTPIIDQCFHWVSQVLEHKLFQVKAKGGSELHVERAMSRIKRVYKFLVKTIGSIRQRMYRLSNKTDRELQEDKVIVSTIHSSKGLEFDRVWVMGCERGVIPHAQADDIEEERRLLYVAMTRARKDIRLSYNNEVGMSNFLMSLTSLDQFVMEV